MKTRRKKLKTLILSAMVAAMMFGTSLTACAAPAATVPTAIPVKAGWGAPVQVTPNGVWVYGEYCYNEMLNIYGTYPAEYLLAIDAAGIMNEMTDYEKCVRINNYLCAVAEYGHGYLAVMQADNAIYAPYWKNLYGANGINLMKLASLTEAEKPIYGDPMSQEGYYLLKSGQGVCTGYADAFQTMACALGIDCIAEGSTQMNHAWNKVVIDGATYYVDVTWNDQSGNRYLMSPVLWADHAYPDIAEKFSKYDVTTAY